MADINTTLLQTMGQINTSLSKMDKTVDDLTKALQTLVKQSSDVAKDQEAANKREMDTRQELEYLATQEIANETKKKVLTDNEIKQRDRLVHVLKDEAAAKRDIKNYLELEKVGRLDSIEGQKKLQGARTSLMMAEKEHKKIVEDVGGGFGKFLGKMNLLGAAITWILGMVVGQYQAQKEAIKLTAGMIDLGDSFTGGRIKLEGLSAIAGLASDATLKTITANRQAVNAMGGTARAITSWSGTMRDTFTSMTGDVDEGFALFLESQTMLRQQGVRPTTEAMQKYGMDLKKMSSMTGMAAEQLASLVNEVASDTDSRVLLKAAREGERAAILASQRALMNMNIAAGMTAEQAKEAAKMLNKMVAAKPIERMKQAARMRALGAAFGVGGGEQAAQAMIAGPRATAQQREQLNDFNKSITNVADQMRGQGLGQEIFSTTLLEKLNLDQYYGESSPFSTTLASSLKNAAGPFVDVMHDRLFKPMISFQEHANQVMDAMNGKLGGIVELLGSIASMLVPAKWFGGASEKAGSAIADVFMSKQNKQIQQMLAGTGGPAAGTKLAAPEAPTPSDRKAGEAAQRTALAGEDQAKSAEEHKQYTKQAATGIDSQLKAMTNANDLLQKIHENSEKQVDLASRQLAAMTLSDQEKKEGRGRLFQGSEYAARYATLV